MFKHNFKKKISKNIVINNIHYKFALLAYEHDADKQVVMISESCNKKKSWLQSMYEIEVNGYKIKQRMFYDFADHFVFNKDFRQDVIDKKTDLFKFPKKTMEHIAFRSNGLNIKKANNGEQEKLSNLRIWHDELSHKNNIDLESVLNEEEVSLIISGIQSFVKGDRMQKEYIRNGMRWCIRGLTVENVLLKLEKEYSDRLYFIKKQLIKKRYSR